MPITAFKSLDDGLQAVSRRRDHFVHTPDLTNDRLWVPYGEKGWVQPCHFNVTTGGFTVIAKFLPGAVVPKHYHVSTVHGYTLQGTWRYLEHDWIATAGTFIYEPAGEAHTLVVPADATEPMIALFVVCGALIYVDDAGGFVAYEDGFTLLELTRKHYREMGLDLSLIDAMIR